MNGSDSAKFESGDEKGVGHVYFWSCVEASLFMDGLLRRLRELGHSAEQRFAISADSYRAAKGPLQRAVLRFKMYGTYPIRLGWACLRSNRSDVHVVTTNPFFAPWIALRFVRRRRPVVHLVYDLFPDALIVDRKLSEGSARARLIRRIVRTTFDRAAANVFLGERLRRHSDATFGAISRTWVIAVGSDATPFAKLAPTAPDPSNAIDVLYCGNLGAMHDVDTLLAAIRIIDDRGIAPGLMITFHASGVAYPAFKARARALSDNVNTWCRFEAPLTDAEWVNRMACAHVALVTMKTGAQKVVMPSKTYSALASGQAILAVCPMDSDLAGIIRSHDCGWVVPPGGIDDLVRALDEIGSSPGLVQRRRENAFRAGQSEYSAEAVGDRWHALLESLGA